VLGNIYSIHLVRSLTRSVSAPLHPCVPRFPVHGCGTSLKRVPLLESALLAEELMPRYRSINYLTACSTTDLISASLKEMHIPARLLEKCLCDHFLPVYSVQNRHSCFASSREGRYAMRSNADGPKITNTR
jgi:hypothetical protein